MSAISKRKRTAADQRPPQIATATTTTTTTVQSSPSPRITPDDDSMDQPTSRDASDEDNTDASMSHPVVPAPSARMGMKRSRTNELLDNSLPVPANHYNYKINPVGSLIKNFLIAAKARFVSACQNVSIQWLTNYLPSLFFPSHRPTALSGYTVTASTTYFTLATHVLSNRQKRHFRKCTCWWEVSCV